MAASEPGGLEAPSSVAALEQHIVDVAAGAPSRFVLALSQDLETLAPRMEELERSAASRGLHVRVPAGSGSLLDRGFQALLARLTERREGRPGVAKLLDPLIERGAEFVMGPDLPQVRDYLSPAELDEVPAIASRVLLQRFVPALASTFALPEDLLDALMRERTGTTGPKPGAAQVLSARARSEALRQLGELAKRSGAPIVLDFGASSEHGAAAAHELASSLPASGFVLLLGALSERFSAEATLLSPDERKRIEASTVRFERAPAPVTVSAPPPPVVAPEPVTAPRVLAVAPPPAPVVAVESAPQRPEPEPEETDEPVGTLPLPRSTVLMKAPATASAAPAKPAARAAAPTIFAGPVGLVVVAGVIVWKLHGCTSATVAPREVAPTVSAAPAAEDAPQAAPVGNPAPAVRPLLERAKGTDQRLQILDGLFQQTSPEDCVATIADLLTNPIGTPGEAQALRVGLLVRLGNYMKLSAAVALAVEWTKTDKVIAERLAALDDLAKAPNLTPDARAQLEALAASDPVVKVQARARDLVGASARKR